jgi:AcrR family transcriptional regulator
MMSDETPTRAAPARRRRRKEARPGEIIAAAAAVFSEVGFGAAKLEDVARRAGVAKATLFHYFATKEELFRAVAHSMIDGHLEALRSITAAGEPKFAEFMPALLERTAHASRRLPAALRLLIGEARTFPDLPVLWYEEVGSKLLAALTDAIERSIRNGEIRQGDARLYAFSLLGPMFSALLFNDLLRNDASASMDLEAMARQHAEVVLRGLSQSDSPLA